MNYLIVGAGPAALAAAGTLRQADRSGSVTILSREKIRPYSRMALPYVLAARIEAAGAYSTLPEGVELLMGKKAVRIDTERREVETASGKAFPYDRLLIASGGTPEKPVLDGGDRPFVFTIRDLPDMTGIRERFEGKTGHAVIAGAGPVGMETGDALHKLGWSVTFVVTSNRVFSTMLDSPAAELVARKLREQGVEILTGEDIVTIGLSGEVHLQSGKTRTCDLLIIGKGVHPCLDFLEGSGIAVARGIVVDESQETSVPGVYAAGDVAETMDIVYGDRRVNALWPLAVEQGRVAALNMAGIPATYPGSLARNILRVFGVSILAAGAGRAGQGYEIMTEQGPDFYHKIVLDKGLLKGFIFVGEVRNEGLYSGLIKRKTDVSAYAGSLLRGSYGYSRYLARAMKTGV
jgi:nitrite reductase (NADH) large subunit